VSHSEHASTKSTLDSHRHWRSARPFTLCAVAAGLALASLTGMPSASASFSFSFTAPGDGILKFTGNNQDGANAWCTLAFKPLTNAQWSHNFPSGPFEQSLHIRSDLGMQVPSQVDIQFSCRGDRSDFQGQDSVYVK
jgi:hypothetical protein